MITVQATQNVERLVNGGGVVVIIKDIPSHIFESIGDGANESLGDFIAKEAGEARKRLKGEFAPEVAIQIIQ